MTNTVAAQFFPRTMRAGLELVWPVGCAGCGRPDVPICPRCRAAVAGPAFSTPVVGWPLGFEAWAACGYRGTAGRLLIAWKERGRADLTEALADGLAAAVRACRGAYQGDRLSPWLLVPVPTSRAGRRQRGGDLMADLAARAASACCPSLGPSRPSPAPNRPSRGPDPESHGRGGADPAGPEPDWPGPPPLLVPALEHARRVQDQGSLGAQGRRANLRGALAVRPSARSIVAGRNCVVVDDVVTTGTTAAEAARALTSAGAHVVGACFLSVTLRRQGVLDEG